MGSGGVCDQAFVSLLALKGEAMQKGEVMQKGETMHCPGLHALPRASCVAPGFMHCPGLQPGERR